MARYMASDGIAPTWHGEYGFYVFWCADHIHSGMIFGFPSSCFRIFFQLIPMLTTGRFHNCICEWSNDITCHRWLGYFIHRAFTYRKVHISCTQMMTMTLQSMSACSLVPLYLQWRTEYTAIKQCHSMIRLHQPLTYIYEYLLLMVVYKA